MWTVALGLEGMAAVDLGESAPELGSIIRQHGLDDRIRLFYGCCQDDRNAVTHILQDMFDAGNLDLVLDDASHLYEQTKTSFEICVPIPAPRRALCHRGLGLGSLAGICGPWL